MRISDWSSDVCSSDLYIDAKATFRELYPDVYTNPSNPFIDGTAETGRIVNRNAYQTMPHAKIFTSDVNMRFKFDTGPLSHQLLVGVDYSNYFERTRSASDTSSRRSEEHTSELQSLMRISYAVLCLNKKKTKK